MACPHFASCLEQLSKPYTPVLQSFASSLVHVDTPGAVLNNFPADAHVILIGVTPCKLWVHTVDVLSNMQQVVGLASHLEDGAFDAVILCKMLEDLVVQVAHLLCSFQESLGFEKKSDLVFSAIIFSIKQLALSIWAIFLCSWSAGLWYFSQFSDTLDLSSFSLEFHATFLPANHPKLAQPKVHISDAKLFVQLLDLLEHCFHVLSWGPFHYMVDQNIYHSSKHILVTPQMLCVHVIHHCI